MSNARKLSKLVVGTQVKATGVDSDLSNTISSLKTRLDSDDAAVQALSITAAALTPSGLTDSDLKVVSDLRNDLDSEILAAKNLVLDYTNYIYTATAGQTTFTGSDDNSATLSYTVGTIQVFLNGILLDGSDYTATSGTSIVLNEAAALNNELVIIVPRIHSTVVVAATTGGFRDESGNNVQVIACGDAAIVDDANHTNFGTHSMIVYDSDGTQNNSDSEAASGCRIMYNSDFNVTGTDSATIDFWVYNSVSFNGINDGVKSFISQIENNSNKGWFIFALTGGGTPTIRFYHSSSNYAEGSYTQMNTTGWHHFAIVWNGSTCRCKIDGDNVITAGGRNLKANEGIRLGMGVSIDGGLYKVSPVQAGGFHQSERATNFMLYDEFRYSTSDKYGTEFSITSPTSAFTDSDDTAVLIHFDEEA